MQATAAIYIPTVLNSTNTSIVAVLPSDYDLDGGMDLLFTVDTNTTYAVEMQLFVGCTSDYHCSYNAHPLNSTLFAGLDRVEPFLLDSKGTGNPTIVVVKNGTRLLLNTNEGTT